ncbi:MAG: archaellin/type IV pilin N-terminal domain-containing protein [Candidatus Aenigmarchaeota archaeon]
MGMKGISPVIAAVLLIAISVAVGVMISSWITHWVSSRTAQASSACVTNTNYRIDSATFHSSTDSLTLVLTNLGNVELYGFSVQILNGTDVYVYNTTDPKLSISPNITETNPLREQRSVVIIIDMTGGYHSSLGSTADQIKILNKACPIFSAETLTITKE